MNLDSKEIFISISNIMLGRVSILTLIFVVCTHAGTISRVVGGKDVPPGKYPFQIITKYMDRFICGGTILNHRYILTAGHCVVGFSVGSYEVVTGINRLTENGTSYSAEKLIVHNNYGSRPHLHDIGLVRVKKDILFSKIVQPVSLFGGSSKSNNEVILIGFGRLGANKPTATVLQEVKLSICPNSKCRSIIPYVEETHVCTLTKPGEGACNGDSGGALLENGKQIGIVSFGVPCAVGAPDVYTRVQSYLPWIINNTRITGTSSDS